MKIMVISLLLALFIIPLTAALVVEFESPDEADMGQEFFVSLQIDSPEEHDVKIFVHNSADSKVARSEYVSEIYSSDWQDSWNYLPASFPDLVEYRVRVTESRGDLTLCVRLRKTGASATYDSCKPIFIVGSTAKEIEESDEPQNEAESSESSVSENNNPVAPEESSASLAQPVNLKNSLPPKEKIVLSSNKNLQEEVTTSEGKTRRTILIAFPIFLFVIIVLLALRRL